MVTVAGTLGAIGALGVLLAFGKMPSLLCTRDHVDYFCWCTNGQCIGKYDQGGELGICALALRLGHCSGCFGWIHDHQACAQTAQACASSRTSEFLIQRKVDKKSTNQVRQSGEIDDWELQRWEKFQGNLNELSKQNTFQRNRFPELFNWETWKGFDDFSNACPLTTKAELEKDRSSTPPSGTNITYPREDYLRYSRTSGTTGDPTTWMDTERDWLWMLKIGCRLWKMLSGEGSRCFSPFRLVLLGFWTAYEAAVKKGALPYQGADNLLRQGYTQFWKIKWSIFCTPPMRCD